MGGFKPPVPREKPPSSNPCVATVATEIWPKPSMVPMESADASRNSQKGFKNQLSPSGHEGVFNHILKKNKQKVVNIGSLMLALVVWRVR